MLRGRGNENVPEMSWWTRCSKVSELSGTKEVITLCKGSFGDGIIDGMVQPEAGNDEKKRQLQHAMLFQNSYWLHVYHDLLGVHSV